MKTKTVFRRLLTVSAALLCLFAMSGTNAHASFFAAVCDDLACLGGNDIIVQDNLGLDTNLSLGVINFSTAAFGFNVLVNTSQSKPMIGNPTNPQLDLTFTATTPDAVSHTVFLFASDTDFLKVGTFPDNFTMTLAATNSGGSGTETARAWGGDNNNNFSPIPPGNFSGANLLSTIGPLSGPALSSATAGSFLAAVSPFALTIGVQITRSTAGTSTGDQNFTAAPVPEPASVALLGGIMLFSVGVIRRRKVRQG